MASKHKHPSVLSYFFHPVAMGVGVLAIGIYFGLQQKETVKIVKQLPTIARAKAFCETPATGSSVSTCIEKFVALDQFVSVVSTEIEPESLQQCFVTHSGHPEATWQCLRAVDGKLIHTKYKSPLAAVGS